MRSFLSLLVVLFPLGLAVGCSAFIDTNDDLLGSPGGGGSDGGTLDDATAPDIGTDGRTDAGPDAEPDANLECAEPCDDGVACTVDACQAGRCTYTLNDDACGDQERCHPVQGCISVRCQVDADCNDGLFCNGEERCDPTAADADAETGCVAGTAPDCADDVDCTDDTCDEGADRCVNAANDALCDDDVGCTVDRCVGDGAPGQRGCRNEPNDDLCDTGYCFIGATCVASQGCRGGFQRSCGDGDACTTDACSDELMMCVHDPVDADEDGYGAERVFFSRCDGEDCDDSDPDVHPNAEELCNRRDDDCDGDIDEGCPPPTGDDCAGALPIDIEGGDGRVDGELTGALDDYSSLCGEAGGRDRVYYFDLTSRVDVEIDTIGSDADTVLAVAVGSGSCGDFFACDDDISPIYTSSRVWLHRVGPPGGFGTLRVYVLVDGFSASTTGDFRINVSVYDSAAPDTCADPLDITDGGSVYGQIGFASLSGDERGTCERAADRGNEAVFQLFASDGSGAEVQAFSRDFAPVLYLRHDPCESMSSEMECERSSLVGGVNHAVIQPTFTSFGDYYAFVDGGALGDWYFLSYNP